MEEITDERVKNALNAYLKIVSLDFDTPAQKLQNIQNASYFIWALFYRGCKKHDEQDSIKQEMLTNVKEEDNSGFKEMKDDSHTIFDDLDVR